MRRIGVDERRARIGLRHRLAHEARTADPVEAARSVVALHATDPATVFLSATARATVRDAGAVERALYEDRSLMRMLGMRRTMWVAPIETAPVIQASSTDAIVPVQRRLLVQHLAENGVADDCASWLREVEEQTVLALASRGEATAAELAKDVPGLRAQVTMARGKPYEATGAVTTRIMFLLAAQGRIARGRPRGTWISGQYRWSPMETWLPGGMPEMSVADAQAELASRWLRAFGPGTEADLKWWTGWKVTDVRRALAAIGAVEVDLGGSRAWVAPDDVEPVATPDPWVALLPALDPTPMGWTERDWYLGDYRAALFDRSGNIGPSVWRDGRIVGGWGQRRDGEVAVRLLDDVGADATSAIEAEAARLREWLGDIRITPRFRTPLERDLS